MQAAELLVVVDLTIEDAHKRLVCASDVHGLSASARQIEDREPPVPEPHVSAVGRIQSRDESVVGSTPPHGPQRALDRGLRKHPPRADNAEQSTHVASFISYQMRAGFSCPLLRLAERGAPAPF